MRLFAAEFGAGQSILSENEITPQLVNSGLKFRRKRFIIRKEESFSVEGEPVFPSGAGCKRQHAVHEPRIHFISPIILTCRLFEIRVRRPHVRLKERGRNRTSDSEPLSAARNVPHVFSLRIKHFWNWSGIKRMNWISASPFSGIFSFS